MTLWSPPHLLGLVGAQINTLGCLAIALELWPVSRPVARTALLAAGTFLLGAFYITLDPSIQTAFRRGGVFFFTWAILGAPTFAFTFATTARLAALRSTPLILVLSALALHYSGLVVADLGFALIQPTPAIEEAIAADPDSAIALAWEMARRNDAPSPWLSPLLRWLPLLPGLLVALLDARRRWTGAVLGVALVAVSGVALGPMPALAQAQPSFTDAVLSILLAALGGFAGTAAGLIVAGRLRSRQSSPYTVLV